MGRKIKEIKIDKISDLLSFIKCAKDASGQVLVYRGRFLSDGKSLLGVLSLNPTEPFTIEYEDADIGFENYLKKFEVLNED